MVLDPRGTEVPGSTTIAWLGESFLLVRTQLRGGEHAHSEMSLVRDDPHDRFVALYHDDRGVGRQYGNVDSGPRRRNDIAVIGGGD